MLTGKEFHARVHVGLKELSIFLDSMADLGSFSPGLTGHYSHAWWVLGEDQDNVFWYHKENNPLQSFWPLLFC